MVPAALPRPRSLDRKIFWLKATVGVGLATGFLLSPRLSTGHRMDLLTRSDENPTGHHETLKRVWHAAMLRAKVLYFRIYDVQSTYATRLGAWRGR